MSNLPKYIEHLQKVEETINTLLDNGFLHEAIKIQKEWNDRYDYISGVINSHSKIINTLNNATEKFRKIKDSTYSSEWKLPQKFMYILLEEKRFLKFREVAEIIVHEDGALPEKIDSIAFQLKSSTKKLKQDNVIIKISPNGKTLDTFWGLPEWLDENGIIKPAYMFDYNAVNIIDALESHYKELYNKKEPEGSA